MRRRGSAVLRQPARHRRFTPSASGAIQLLADAAPAINLANQKILLANTAVRHATLTVAEWAGVRVAEGAALLSQDNRHARRKRAAAAAALQNLAALRSGAKAIVENGVCRAASLLCACGHVCCLFVLPLHRLGRQTQ